MRTPLALVSILAAIGCFSQQLIFPTRHILPADVEQTSVKMVRFTTNIFAVRWTYTEAGAKKMLAFNHEHAGREVLMQIGDFERLVKIAPLDTEPPGWTEEGYLKSRGDKFFAVSEDDAKKIVEGLKPK